MCGGVEAREAEKIWKIYFPNPKAALSVLLEDSGQLDWISWGRRTEQPGYGHQVVGRSSALCRQAAGPSITHGVASSWRSASWRKKVGQAKEVGRRTGSMCRRGDFGVLGDWRGGTAASLCGDDGAASRACVDS